MHVMAGPQAQGPQKFRLLVEDPGRGEPFLANLPAGEYVFGRREDCDICFDNHAISKQHCKLLVDPLGMPFVADIGSRNGTFVKAGRIQPGFYYPLGHQDEVTFCDVRLVILNS